MSRSPVFHGFLAGGLGEGLIETGTAVKATACRNVKHALVGCADKLYGKINALGVDIGFRSNTVDFFKAGGEIVL